MKTIRLITFSLAMCLGMCATITPEQQANIDKAVGIALNVAGSYAQAHKGKEGK